jgi:hypothetical protein
VRRYFRSFRAMVALYRIVPRAFHGAVDHLLACRLGLGAFGALVAAGQGIADLWRRTFGRLVRRLGRRARES